MGASGRRIILRLDDGSLIGDGDLLLGNGAQGPVLLDSERAFSLGRLGKRELERLDGLIQTFHERVPDLLTVPKPAIKSSNPYTTEVRCPLSTTW